MASEVIRNIRLHDGTWVEERLYESVLQQIRKALPALNQYVKYTAKRLCGKEFWDQLAKCDQINAGKCLVHMVENGLLHLSFAESNHEYPKKYQLK